MSKAINPIPVCPQCGFVLGDMSNLDYARHSLEKFRERTFSDAIIERAEKMAEQYEEAIVDAVEDEYARIVSVLKSIDSIEPFIDDVLIKIVRRLP